MINFKHFLIDLQQGVYLASSKHEPPQFAEKSNFIRFTAVLYLNYVSIFILLEGIIVKLSGPFRLDFLKASVPMLVIPYFLYKLFLQSLIIKRFDFILPNTEKSKRIKLYYYVLVGSFCSFFTAFSIVFYLFSKAK
jgi:hypothetical protein